MLCSGQEADSVSDESGTIAERLRFQVQSWWHCRGIVCRGLEVVQILVIMELALKRAPLPRVPLINLRRPLQTTFLPLTRRQRCQELSPFVKHHKRSMQENVVRCACQRDQRFRSMQSSGVIADRPGRNGEVSFL
jgi:hypothetical protein